MVIPNQRDIVYINYPLPNNKFEEHPVLVISNNEVNGYDGGEQFIGVMLSATTEYDDEYSFWLDDDMATKGFTKKTQVRCHLIQVCYFDEIIAGKDSQSMKKKYFEKILDHINYNVC